MDYLSLIKSEKYDFLRTNPHLGNHIILIGLGGSHAYGTNVEGSDIDIRGCSLNSKEEILTNKNFEQFINNDTDTVIYSFNKLINLLSNCNPNTIEILGLKPEHYLYLSDIGHELIYNRQLFLSVKAVNSFGGYANAQLRRLDNKAVRLTSQAEQEQHILNSIRGAMYDFPRKYFRYEDNQINLYIDKAVNPEMESEIFMDVSLHHYPLRDYKAMWSEMNNIVKDYAKLGKRNTHAIEHNKLGKHMMHLVRLYYMCFDILEKKEIITYRSEEHNLLMDIRAGKFLNENQQPTDDFTDLINELELRLAYDKVNTDLPQNPDYKKINEFVADVNEQVVRGTI